MEIMVPLPLWKELPDDLKAVVELGAYTYETWMNSDYDRINAERIQMMREKFGIKIQQLPDEDVKKLGAASVRVMDKYSAKDARFAKGAEILKKFMRQRGLIK
jgi:TRAP-type mannitol/chloroaromatic compound transport system substrate-binding protein